MFLIDNQINEWRLFAMSRPLEDEPITWQSLREHKRVDGATPRILPRQSVRAPCVG